MYFLTCILWIKELYICNQPSSQLWKSWKSWQWQRKNITGNYFRKCCKFSASIIANIIALLQAKCTVWTMYHQDIGDPVLPVNKCNIDKVKIEAAENGDISQMSVDEYMVWVQRQASKLPGVVRMDVSPSAGSKSSDSKTSTPTASTNGIDSTAEQKKKISDILDFTGNSVWKKCMLNEYEDLRERLAQQYQQCKQQVGGVIAAEMRMAVPALRARDHWFIFCFGKEAYLQWCERTDCRSIFEDPGQEASNAAEDEYNGTCDGEMDVVLDPDTAACIHSRRLALQGDIRSPELLQKVETGSDAGTERDPGDIMLLSNDSVGDSDSASASISISNVCAPTYVSAKFDPNLSPSCMHPSVTLLLQIDHVMTQRILAYLEEWLEAAVCCDREGFCYSNTDMEFNRRQSEYLYTSYYYVYLWLYALLARIEKPLHKDSSAVIRSLCKHCIELRFLVVEYCMHIRGSNSNSSDASAANVIGVSDSNQSTTTIADTDNVTAAEDYYKKLVSMLNILILISGVYFGQGGDLLMEENNGSAADLQCH